LRHVTICNAHPAARRRDSTRLLLLLVSEIGLSAILINFKFGLTVEKTLFLSGVFAVDAPGETNHIREPSQPLRDAKFNLIRLRKVS
jgi:hypothetical protein